MHGIRQPLPSLCLFIFPQPKLCFMKPAPLCYRRGLGDNQTGSPCCHIPVMLQVFIRYTAAVIRPVKTDHWRNGNSVLRPYVFDFYAFF